MSDTLVGKTVQLRVDALVYRGDGIGRHMGRAIFVPFSAPGDTLLCRITQQKRRFARGRVEKVVVPFPCRVEPRCPLFTQCGGCQWQHIDHGTQLEAKREILSSALERGAGISPEVVEDILPSETWGYRSRCQLRCGPSGEGLGLGFFEGRSHRVVDVPRCPVLTQGLNGVLSVLRHGLEDALSLFSQIHLEEGDQGAPRVGMVVRRGVSKRRLEEVLLRLGQVASESRFSLLVLLHDSGPEEVHLEAEPLVSPLGGSDLLLGVVPLGFFQGNLGQNRALNRLLLEKIGEVADDASSLRVLDLFCGMGNLSIPLASRCGEVVGVEVSPWSVEMAWMNARRNGVSNVRFLRDEAVNFLRLSEPGQFDLVVLDPPRAGARHEVSLLAELRPQAIIYVSCDPMTLARDLRTLVSAGYQVRSSTPIDMFPHTFHVESVTTLVLG